MKHSAPGNVRELRNMIDQVVLMTTDNAVSQCEQSFVGQRSADAPMSALDSLIATASQRAN